MKENQLMEEQQDKKQTKDAKQSSAKKKRKVFVDDPKQRKLSFPKVSAKVKAEESISISSDSDLDEPLISLKNSKSEVDKLTKKDDKTGHIDTQKSRGLDKKKEKISSPSAKRKVIPTLIRAKDSSNEILSKKDGASNSKQKKSSPKKDIHKANGIGKLMHGKSKNSVNYSLDSDSDLDIPLSELRNSPKFKLMPSASKEHTPSKDSGSKKKKSNTPNKLKKLINVERSPKVKISCAKSLNHGKLPGERDYKQKTLFEFSANSVKALSMAKESLEKSQFSIESSTQKIGISIDNKPKVDWKNLSEAEKEKIRQQKRDEWNRMRREKNKFKNQKFDDLELTNVTPLPAAKPLVMPDGLPSSAFGDVAMIIEFLYTFNQFLAPEEKPSITAELLMKALAAGSQGAYVVSKILLVFLRALIGEEEREVNGLGLGLADMPLTVFTVSDLVYYYLIFACKDSSAEKDDNDDASSVGSGDDAISDNDIMPKRIIECLEKNEFFTLPASDQLKVLVFLFYKIIDSEYFLDYLENLKLEAKELWRQQDAYRKKTAKEKKPEQTEATDKKQGQDVKTVLTLDKFSVKEATDAQPADVKSTVSEKEATATVQIESNEKTEVTDEKKVEDSKELKGASDSDLIIKKADNQEVDVDDNLLKDYPKEPVSDLVHIVRQRRVMAAKQAQLRDEEERKEKERRKILDEIHQQTKRLQAWRDCADRCKKSLRLEPLGVDRHFKLYWVFSGGMPGIYIEDGWMYHAIENRTINSWEYYDTVEDVEKLLKALIRQGERESALRVALSSHYKTILNDIKKRNPEQFSLISYNVFEESLKVLKEDMIESGNRIVKGVLGLITNHEKWASQVNDAKSLEDAVPLVLELQQGIFPKFLEGTFSQSQKGEITVQKWRENVQEVKTLSALHTLFGILENSVKWDKSAENVKCKICRRKANGDYLVLCDECNRGYHPYCLRPALLDIPTEKWKCPACAPIDHGSRSSRSTRRVADAAIDEAIPEEEASTEEEDTEELEEENGDNADTESDHESLCHVCGEDGELICCDQCPKVYHLDCHEPPIRRLPRGMWICFICRNPKAITRLQKKNRCEKDSKSRSRLSKRNKKALKSDRARKARNINNSDSSEDEIDDREEDVENQADQCEDLSEEDEELTRVKANDSRRSKYQKRPKRNLVLTDESDEDHDGDDSDDDAVARRKKRKSGRISNKEEVKKKRSREDEACEEISQSGRKKKRKYGKLSNESSENQNENQSDKEKTKRKRVERRQRSKYVDDATNGAERKPRSEGFERIARNNRNRYRKQNLEIIACEDILHGMWKNENSDPFRNPVDTKKVTDYKNYVPNPIDLSTIREKLNMLEYEDAFQFVDDMKLLFQNSKAYNQDDSHVGKSALKLEKLFEELLKVHLPGLLGTLNDSS